MVKLDLTILVISSPFASMPSLSIIDNTINSLSNISGLEDESIPIYILLDGYEVSDEVRMKKGKINADQATKYQQYYDALHEKYGCIARYKIIQSETHRGFACMVKWGLEMCNTTFALILQHDRYFCHPFTRLTDLLQSMHQYEHIRYIGFPTFNSYNHDRTIYCTYHLSCLVQPPIKITLGENLYLQPLIFWFDSQHIAHVKRYLQIFKPYRNIPISLRDKIGLKAVKDMFLREGDFIEDRFGQIQRNLLTSWMAMNKSTEEIIELFQWYGSYLCWLNHSNFETDFHEGKSATIVMVKHMHGRVFDIEKIQEMAEIYGITKSKRYGMLTNQSSNSSERDDNEEEKT